MREVIAVHIVDVPVVIVIDAVARDFACVHPNAVVEIDVIEVDTAIGDANHN